MTSTITTTILFSVRNMNMYFWRFVAVLVMSIGFVIEANDNGQRNNVRNKETKSEERSYCKLSAPGSKFIEKDCIQIENRISEEATANPNEATITKHQSLMNSNGTFMDLNLEFVSDLREHARRLRGLSSYEIKNDGTLSQTTKNGFKVLAYDAPNITSSNWWDFLIGAPGDIWKPIFVSRFDLDDQLRNKLLDRYFAYTDKGPVWNPTQQSGRFAGGNLGPRMTSGLVEAFLRGPKRLIKFSEQLRKVLYKEVVLREPFQGNGMRHDGCLHQHNQVYTKTNADGTESEVILSQTYNNNYGKEFLKHASFVMYILDGTSLDLREKVEEGIFASFLECQQWLYRGTTVEPSTVGRFIDSGSRITKYGGQGAVANTVKYLMRVNRHEEECLAAYHRYYDSQPSELYALQGNRHFFVSDIMAHQRVGFMSSLRLLSERTCRPESVESLGQNSQGYFEGDGFLTVLVSGDELGSFHREVFQAYDFARIPGTTVQYTTNVPTITTYSNERQHCYNDADFVGGVTNKMDGVATMEYARPTVPVRAKKSWFFFDDVILCLGSAITLPAENETTNPVTTTLNQIVYENEYTYGYEDLEGGKTVQEVVKEKKYRVFDLAQKIWIHHGTIGYVPLSFEGQMVLELDRRVLPNQPEDPYIYTFTLWQDHGNRPVNADYAYAMLPSYTKEQTEEFAKSPTIKILAQTQSLHAACSPSNQILGSVFFVKGCLDTSPCSFAAIEEVCSDRPALVLLNSLTSELATEKCPNGVKPLVSKNVNGETKSVLQISVSDPTQKLEMVELTLKIEGKTYTVSPSLPKAPTLGDSRILCYEM